MVEATLFIGAVIIGLTQLAKLTIANVHGWVTIVVAILVGVIVGFIDQAIGVTDITVAEGIMLALAASGVTTVAKKVG